MNLISICESDSFHTPSLHKRITVKWDIRMPNCNELSFSVWNPEGDLMGELLLAGEELRAFRDCTPVYDSEHCIYHHDSAARTQIHRISQGLCVDSILQKGDTT